MRVQIEVCRPANSDNGGAEGGATHAVPCSQHHQHPHYRADSTNAYGPTTDRYDAFSLPIPSPNTLPTPLPAHPCASLSTSQPPPESILILVSTSVPSCLPAYQAQKPTSLKRVKQHQRGPAAAVCSWVPEFHNLVRASQPRYRHNAANQDWVTGPILLRPPCQLLASPERTLTSGFLCSSQ